MSPEAAVGLLATIVVGLIGWLLNRSVRAVDDSIHTLNGKIDTLAATDAQQGKELVSQDVRLRHVEVELGALRSKYEDLAGFLQGSGFRKRDGP